MSLKKILMSLSILGITVTSLSIGACSSGSSSPQATTVPKPVAVPQTPPSGYSLPTGSAANGSTVYISSAGGLLSGLALPQGVGTSAIQISAPSGVPVNALISALVQQFGGSSALALVISNIAGGTLVNVSASSLSGAAQVNVKATEVNWNAFTFSGITGTSTPLAVSANNGAYLGTSVSNGGFLAFQSTANSPSNPLTYAATVAQCGTASASTEAISIADTTLSSGNYIGIGTNDGEVLIYGVSGANANSCQNLTKANGASAYSLGSPVGALSFTGTSANNYGYFATQNGQVWRIVATTNNVPVAGGFTQINGSGFSNAPTSGLSSLYSDKNNNVYVGTNTGVLYLLAPTNSSGPNTTWTSLQLVTGSGVNDTSPITSISTTTAGGVIAVTANGVYNVGVI